MPLVGNCPNCDDLLVVERNDIACGIFRHGVYKKNLLQIDPHAPKQICDFLVNSEQIFGCGKPFQYDKSTDSFKKCAYI